MNSRKLLHLSANVNSLAQSVYFGFATLTDTIANIERDKHTRPYVCKEPGCEKILGFTYAGIFFLRRGSFIDRVGRDSCSYHVRAGSVFRQEVLL